MKAVVILLIYIVLIPITNAQDTLNITGVEGDYWVEYRDSIIQNGKTFYGWRKEDYVNYMLFTVEYLTEDKIQPIGEYTGYFPDEKIAFKLTYWYDGEYTELHGIKELYYENGNLKENGQYCHGFKCGKWKFYNNDGSLAKTTEYNSPIFDTITSFKTAASYKEFLTKDTIFIERVSLFYSYFPCISLGKTGVELCYKDGIPFEARKFYRDSLLYKTNDAALIDHFLNIGSGTFNIDTLYIKETSLSCYQNPEMNKTIKIYQDPHGNFKLDLFHYEKYSYKLIEYEKPSRKERKMNEEFLSNKNVQLNTDILFDTLSLDELFLGWNEDVLEDSIQKKVQQGNYKYTSLGLDITYSEFVDTTITINKYDISSIQDAYFGALTNPNRTKPHGGAPLNGHTIEVVVTSSGEEKRIGINTFYDYFDLRNLAKQCY